MASPQKENGFTSIANEILDNMSRQPLNGTQFRILMIIFRFTYGFNRKEHQLSESFISKATSIHKKQIQREINELIDYKIVVVTNEASFRSPRSLMFNKDYDSWEVTKKLPGSEKDTHTGSELVTSPGSFLVTQEINIYKDNIKEKDIYINNDINTRARDFDIAEPQRESKILTESPKISKKTISDLITEEEGEG